MSHKKNGILKEMHLSQFLLKVLGKLQAFSHLVRRYLQVFPIEQIPLICHLYNFASFNRYQIKALRWLYRLLSLPCLPCYLLQHSERYVQSQPKCAKYLLLNSATNSSQPTTLAFKIGNKNEAFILVVLCVVLHNCTKGKCHECRIQIQL